MKRKYILASTFLLILLFCYAAVEKGMNIKLFHSQMMQSPFIPPQFVNILQFTIPALEIITALMLAFDKTRQLGFYFSYIIMLAFSVYLILLVSLYSGDIPCACGGIFEKMNYSIHIAFNLFFTVLALVSILLSDKYKSLAIGR